MNHLRFIGLLCGVLLLFYSAFWLYEHHIIAAALSLKTVFLGVVKKVSTKAFWEHAPLILGKWGLKSVAKGIFIHLPKTILLAFVLVLVGPYARRFVRTKLWVISRRGRRYVRRFRKWCDAYFGTHGVAAFLVAIIASTLLFLVSAVFFGFELIFWLGKWGPIGTFFTWLTSGITRFFYGAIYNVPFLSRLFAWGGQCWKQYIAPKFPLLALWHRRTIIRVLRLARRWHLITTDAHERMVCRLRNRKE